MLKKFDIIMDSCFVSHLEKGIAILKPIDKAIVCLEGDSVPVSEIHYLLMVDLKNQYESMECLEELKKTYLLGLLQARMDFLYGNAIGIAYLLDLRYLGDGMATVQKRKTEDIIFNFVHDQKETLFMEYTQFMNSAGQEHDASDFWFQMLMNQTKTVLQYLLIDSKEYRLLREIAVKVFSMVTSSAAFERNFSMMGFVHSKLRNSLKQESVKKLVYIKTNAP